MGKFWFFQDMLQIDHSTDSFILNTDDIEIGNAGINIQIGLTDILVTDSVSEKGLEYAGDYSANYTTRSIVDKDYVDTAIAAASGGGVSAVLLDYTETTNTGNVTNNIMSPNPLLIPGGTFTTGDMMHIRVAVGATNGAGAQTIRLYFNTSHSLSGATLIATDTDTTDKVQIMTRDIRFVASNSQKIYMTTTGNLTLQDDVGTAGNITPASLALDFASDVYFIVAIQKANSADTSWYWYSEVTKVTI